MKLRILLAALLLQPTAALSAQERSPARPERSEYQLFDGLAATVDDRAVTFAQVDEVLLSRLDRIPRTDQGALSQASWAIVQEFIRKRIQAQGGAELGISREDVRRVARDLVVDQRRPFGPLEYGARLRERGSDPLREERETTAELYESVWMGTVTGRNSAGGLRPRVDRHIRPSQLRAAYEQNLDRLGTPPDVELQVLDILGAAVGGLEVAREEAARLRAEALAGRDFGSIVREMGYTAREREGRLAPVRADELADPELVRFALSAAIGDLSQPRPMPGERGNLVGYRVVKLLARTGGAPPPPLTDREIQRSLREQLLDRHDRLAIDTRGRALMESSNIWLHPVWGGPAARAAEAPRRSAR